MTTGKLRDLDMDQIGILKEDDPDEVKRAQRTMLRLGKWVPRPENPEIPREQMRDLVLMITPDKFQPGAGE